MKDLSRKDKLRQQIFDMAKEYDDKKWKRVKRTFCVLSVAIYLLVFMNHGMNCAQDFLLWIPAAPVSAGIVMFVSYMVLFYIINESLKEEKAISKKTGELEAIKLFEAEIRNLETEMSKYKEFKNDTRRMGDLVEIIIDEYRSLEVPESSDGEDEEIESAESKLENLKEWLKMIDMEYKLLKRSEVFKDDTNINYNE